MFGANPGHNLDREDTYGYDDDKLDWFQRFDLRPVDPATISARIDDGATLQTVDIPRYLTRGLAVEPETGVALYRLIQLFGTPNVDVWTAGSDMPERGTTTWQYLFDVVYEGESGDREFLLSIYDFKTDVSVGLSSWEPAGEDEGSPNRAGGEDEGSPDRAGGEKGPVAEPSDAVPPGVEMPDDEFCEGLVQLALNVLEEPVPATHEGLWI